MHIFDLRGHYWPRTKHRETDEMYRFDLSPEGPNLDGQESKELTSVLVFFRETLEKFGV